MQKFAYNRIFPHMRLHFSAFLCILSNVNTRACVIYAAYFQKCRIYAAYVPHILAHISPNSAYFSRISCTKTARIF